MHYIFDGDVAAKYGILEAVLYQNILYWTMKNEANGINEHDGYFWTYNTVNAWQELFPFTTKDKIRRALDHLVAEGVLLKGNYNQLSMDRTAWYAIAKFDKSNWQGDQIDLADLPNAFGSDAKAIPNINANINTNINTDGENLKRVSDKQLAEDFEAIWDAYPNKKGKPNALRDYIKARRKGVTDETILMGIEKYKMWIKANHSEKYIKNGSTWFHQECWNDDYTIHYTDIRDVPIDMTETLEEWARGL